MQRYLITSSPCPDSRPFRPSSPSSIFTDPHVSQNNHTYAKSTHTATKNPNQTLQPTPVFSAIRNIRFMVPRNRTRVLSKESFIVSAREDDERISSPMEMVI